MSDRREVNVERPEHSWIPFYRELAEKLVKDGWREKQGELVGVLKEMRAAGLPVPKPLSELPVDHIDPFTFFAAFNGRMTPSNRAEIIFELGKRFNVDVRLKSVAFYVPDIISNNLIFFNWEKQTDYIKRIGYHWDTFEFVLNTNPFESAFDSAKFVKLIDRSLAVTGVDISKLSSTFYWVNPERLLHSDTINGILDVNALKYGAKGDIYLNSLRSARSADHRSFLEINDEIYLRDHEALPLPNVWMVRGGRNRHAVQDFLSQGRVGIGFGVERIDLSTVNTETELRRIYRAQNPNAINLKVGSDVRQISDFLYAIKIGDFVVMPDAYECHHGMVISRPYQEEDCRYKNSRRVRWSDTSRGEMQIPLSQLPPRKTVGVVSDGIKELVLIKNDIIRVQDDDSEIPNNTVYDLEAMLEEGVFFERDVVKRILDRFEDKKNLILQGPPGVGKTFVSKRLAYALMGERDDDRIVNVQFHQSYSYEEFVRGYRPDVNERDELIFEVHNGAFLRLCEKARVNPDDRYVMVIDEINRGNLSRVFGELLSLIEKDKRGVGFSVELLGGDEFSVPENVYLLGTMNLADRSLAGMDYAMRRRFAFVTLKPQFGKSVFEEWLSERRVPDTMIELINSRMSALNDEISRDPSLGRNFAVGHSYFCDIPGDAREWEDSEWNRWYAEIIETEIRPLLEEYWFDNASRADQEVEKLLRV